MRELGPSGEVGVRRSVSMGRSRELGLSGDQVPMGRVSGSIQLVCRQGMGHHGNKGLKYRSGLDHGDHECWLEFELHSTGNGAIYGRIQLR